MKRDFQILFLREHGLGEDHTLLDVGCGTLRGGIPVIRLLEPGHYCGVEVRQEALDNGRAELEDAKLTHKNPRLVLADDLGALQLDQRFDFAWAFSVLIHMDDSALQGCLKLVAAHLEAQGRFFANVNIHAEGEPTPTERRWQGFPVVSRSLRFYEDTARAHGLGITDLGTLESLGHASGMPAHDAQHMLRIEPLAAS
jgi:SAM-dependent methyltransferase